jgi:stalled ribosome rescue protein Dom34
MRNNSNPTVAVVWLDRELAKVFKFSEHGFLGEKKFTAHHIDHHTHARDAFDRERSESPLFRDIGQELEGVQKLLIIGPGMAKYHFRSYLMEQKPLVARNVERVESSDHPTEAQIAALAKDFFDKITA